MHTCASEPPRASGTSASMPPACAIATWLPGEMQGRSWRCRGEHARSPPARTSDRGRSRRFRRRSGEVRWEIRGEHGRPPPGWPGCCTRGPTARAPPMPTRPRRCGRAARLEARCRRRRRRHPERGGRFGRDQARPCELRGDYWRAGEARRGLARLLESGRGLGRCTPARGGRSRPCRWHLGACRQGRPPRCPPSRGLRARGSSWELVGDRVRSGGSRVRSW